MSTHQLSDPVFNSIRGMFEIEEKRSDDFISKHLFSTEQEANDFLIDYTLEGQPNYHSDIKYKAELGENREHFASLTIIKIDSDHRISLLSAYIPYNKTEKQIRDITFYGDAARKAIKQLPAALQLV